MNTRDLLVSGGLLHDIGKLLEYENRDDGMTVQTYAGKLLRHPFTGMELAARFGLPAEVQHIIAAHAGEGDKVKRTTEATLINHADLSAPSARGWVIRTSRLHSRPARPGSRYRRR